MTDEGFLSTFHDLSSRLLDTGFEEEAYKSISISGPEEECATKSPDHGLDDDRGRCSFVVVLFSLAPR